MKIRKISVKDLPILWEFDKKNRDYNQKIINKKLYFVYAFTKDDNARKRFIKWSKSYIKENNKIGLIAEIKNNPVGFLMGAIQIKFFPKKAKIGYISDIFVDEHTRKKGIAKLLMMQFSKWAKNKGASWIELAVASDNKLARAVYNKLKFLEYSIKMRKEIR